LKRWGSKAKYAMLDELCLFLEQEVFELVVDLIEDQERNAMRIHCFLTEKRGGRIKARAVADGRSQVRNMEEETYSLTVKLESIMLCSIIDALEKRHVVKIEIKGAVLKAKVTENLELIVKMDGELAKTFSELNPKFKVNDTGILYLKCLKALYHDLYNSPSKRSWLGQFF
jgi:hypothetical protein